MKYPRVRDMREDRDLKQADVAKYLGIGQATYSKYESGHHNMTPEVLIKLAKFHNTSVDYLLSCTDTKEPYTRSSTM